jgi:energy-coupling factor transport system permease protein
VQSDIGIAIHIGIIMVFLAVLRLPKQAAVLGIYYLSVQFLFALSVNLDAPQAVVTIVFLLRKVSPVMGIAFIFLRSLTVGELISALSKMRFPKFIVLALAVALRFVPTIRRETSQIKDALALRGRPLKVISFVRAPLEMTECVLMPLMMRGVKIADELSASAVTRGIENPEPRTSRRPLQFRAADIVYLCAICGGMAGLLIYELGVHA